MQSFTGLSVCEGRDFASVRNDDGERAGVRLRCGGRDRGGSGAGVERFLSNLQRRFSLFLRFSLVFSLEDLEGARRVFVGTNHAWKSDDTSDGASRDEDNARSV